MKGIYLTLLIFLLSLKLLAQTPATVPPLPFRDVSGIVRDEKDEPLAGAVVLLKSPLDSAYTTTNANGIFVFKQIKRASFYITVSGQGIPAITNLFRNNDLAKQIVLDPIELKPLKSIELKEVILNGQPTITYKQDTVEYKASDYKVREGDRLEELLKKMEGFDIRRDGTLLYQGKEIEKARLNGTDFLGGSVGQVIQNLPADIIEKAQVIDDHGEQAAKTGIKTTEPVKVLNVTTRPDRSIGTYVNAEGKAGNDDRYTANVNFTHINANRQVGLTGRINNTQSGLSTGIHGGGGGGTMLSASPSLSYSNQWRKLKITSGYNYNFSDNNSINKSFGEAYSSGQTTNAKNTSFFTRESVVNPVNEEHRGSARLNYTLNESNSLYIESNFNYTSGKITTSTYDDRINNFATGFEHLLMNGTNTDNTVNSAVGLNTMYQHFFKKPRRNLSIQVGINRIDNKADGRKHTTYSFFADDTPNTRLRSDSLANLQTRRTSNNTTFNTTVTFLEPLSQTSQIEFSGRINRSVFDNVAKQDTVLANGQLKELSRLSNIFNYAFTENRVQLNYTYTGKKINLSAGGTLLPTTLTGTMINNNTNQTVSSSVNNFRVIPVLRFTYVWSTSNTFNLTYRGSNTIPDFRQIQPFTDTSDPIYITTGNPNLKPSFTNNISASYNNYIVNSKIIISLTADVSEIKNQVVSNIIQRPGLIATNPDRYRTIYETTFVNLDGSNAVKVNYALGKQLADSRFNLVLTGSVNYGNNVAVSNNEQYHTTNWRINQRFSPKFNFNDNIEVNPYITYDISRSFTSLSGANPTLLQTTSLAIDGRFFINDLRRLKYNASKSFVTGLGALNRNPLILGAGVEWQLAKKNSLYFTFDVFDVLRQNNFIQQTVTPQGVINTLSNTLSRYCLLGLRTTFQKWGSRPRRNGQDLKRKGDGSFIY